MEEVGTGAFAAATAAAASEVVESVVHEAQQQQQPAAAATAAAAAAAAAEGAAAMGMQAAEACAAAVSGLWPPPSVDWDAMAAHMRALGAFARQGRDALQEALAASWVATQAWWRVAVLLGRPVLRLLLHLWRLALPYLQWAGQKCFDHLKEQEPEVLLAYAGFVALLVGLALLRRLLRRLRIYDRLRAWGQRRAAAVERQYQRATNKLRQYSRRAAEALPHLLFALLAVAACWLFPAPVHAAASRAAVFNILLIYLPALACFHALQSPAAPKKLQAWLPYWVAVAGLLALQAAAEQLWLRWTARLIPYAGELALFFALWLHVPQAGGALVQQHLRPFLHARLGGLLALQARRDAAVGGLLRVAVFARLLSQRNADRLAAHVDELLLVVPAAVLTLSPLAGWGLAFISLLYPAYATVRAMGDEKHQQQKHHHKQQQQSYPAEPWLRYWVVYALSHLLFQALPFWNVIQMWYFLWLLLPHFDGLPLLLDGRNLVFALLSHLYNQQPPQPTKAGGAGEGGRVGKGEAAASPRPTSPKDGKPHVKHGNRTATTPALAAGGGGGSSGGGGVSSPKQAPPPLSPSSSSSSSWRRQQSLSPGGERETKKEL